MFQQLSNRFSHLVQRLRGQGRLSEENIQEALNEVRTALIEADVALPLIQPFLDQVKTKALGQEVQQSINPGQLFIKIVHDELTHLLGDKTAELNIARISPTIILLAGLQGSGKTTTAGKLAYWFKNTQRSSVGMVSTDIYRPAALEQIQVLAQQIGVTCYPTDPTQSPVRIVEQALQKARHERIEVFIIDTAGRLHVDDAMMEEIKAIHQHAQPHETLFVIDSMTGQDALHSTNAFNAALPLSGVILTKTDGDARGGVALSVRQITGKPIQFIGVGEKIDALERFHPERLASRILDMGDIVTLVEEAERKLDREKNEKLAKKLKKGKEFDLNDLLEQIEQMQNMGGIMGIMSKLPGMNAIPQAAKASMNDGMFLKMKAIVQSMTPKERRFPAVINGSRKKRIAAGSGTQIPDINRLLKQFEQMQKMMKKMAKPGAMRGLMQRMPPNFMPPTERNR